MNIAEAVKKALKTKSCIKRESGTTQTRIKPTDSYDCCIIYVSGKKNQQCRYWNPTADDLIADDWQCVSGEESI